MDHGEISLTYYKAHFLLHNPLYSKRHSRLTMPQSLSKLPRNHQPTALSTKCTTKYEKTTQNLRGTTKSTRHYKIYLALQNLQCTNNIQCRKLLHNCDIFCYREVCGNALQNIHALHNFLQNLRLRSACSTATSCLKWVFFLTSTCRCFMLRWT